jgi:hypothetical protein
MPHFIFIQQISVLNILNMLYNLHFFSSKCRLFHNATLFGFCITHILNTGCAKIWKKVRRRKVKTESHIQLIVLLNNICFLQENIPAFDYIFQAVVAQSVQLRTGRSGYRILMGVTFSPHVWTGPGAHPASCTRDTGTFLGVKRPGRDVDHPLSSSVEVKEELYLYLYFLSVSSRKVMGRPLPLLRPCCLLLTTERNSWWVTGCCR